MDQTSAESPAPPSGAGWIVGSGILVVLHGFLAMLRDRTSARTTAYVIGTFFGGALVVGAIGLVVYGIVRAIGRTKPASTAAKIVFWVLFAFLILNVAQLLGRAVNPRSASAQAAFTDAQRHGLQIGADSIRNASLGFALPSPGPTFVPNHEFERQLAEQFGGQFPRDLIYWVLRDTAQRQGLSIQVTGLAGLNEKEFRGFAQGLREGVTKSKVVAEALIWNDTQREARLATHHPNGLYLVTRCVPSLKPRAEFIVCAMTYSEELTGMSTVSNGLTLTR